MLTITHVEVKPNLLSVFLSNNTICSYHFTHAPAAFLAQATPEQWQNWQLLRQGTAVEWPELERILTVKKLLQP